MKTTSIDTVLEVRLRHEPGTLARVATAIAEHKGLLCEIVTVRVGDEHTQREITVETDTNEQVADIIAAIKQLPGAEVLSTRDRVMEAHHGGKIETRARSITSDMLIAAARTIASWAERGDLVPSPLDRALHDAIAMAVARCAVETGVANTARP